jgi:hypothetical protein
MGRSFSSVRQELKAVAERWERTARHPKGDVPASGERLAGWAKQHSSEAFFGCNGPAEAALFSVLIEVQRLRDRHASAGTEAETGITGGDDDLDP